MKITDVTTFKLSVPTGHPAAAPGADERHASATKPWLFLKLSTDTELVGWGEGSGEWLVEPVESMLHTWRPLLLGRDPLQVVALTEDITNRLPWKGGPIIGSAIAAVNMALYDLAGKAWGVPVHTILGGSQRDRVRVYASGALDCTDPARAAERSRAVIDAGYAGIKGNPLEGRRHPTDPQALALGVACVEAARRAIGPDPAIMLDTHASPTPEMSVEFARSIAPSRPLFLEEPVKVGSLEALADVARQSPVPIAAGEKLFSVDQFTPLIDARACAYLQPDVTHCFGITTLLEIAQRAERAQMLMAPHHVAGPLAFAATLHADAVMNNFLIQEVPPGAFDQYARFAEHDWVIQDGYVNLFDRPGLGVEIKQEAIAGAPYEPMQFRDYRHEDGSWKGW